MLLFTKLQHSENKKEQVIPDFDPNTKKHETMSPSRNQVWLRYVARNQTPQ